jgi:hypothetical protein
VAVCTSPSYPSIYRGTLSPCFRQCMERPYRSQVLTPFNTIFSSEKQRARLRFRAPNVCSVCSVRPSGPPARMRQLENTRSRQAPLVFKSDLFMATPHEDRLAVVLLYPSYSWDRKMTESLDIRSMAIVRNFKYEKIQRLWNYICFLEERCLLGCHAV